MKKHFTCLTFSLLFSAGTMTAQSYAPIAATGYTLDAVAEAQTAMSTTGGQIDGSNYVLYSQAYGALYSPVGTGLPNNGLISAGTKTFQLQPYTGPNMLFMTAGNADSLSLTTPAPYAFLSLLSISTEGAATTTITVRFTDNTTQQFTGLTVADWFGTATPFYSGFDRASRGSGNLGYAGSNPKMFTVDLAISCANLAKSVQRVVIRNTHNNARLGIMALSGTSTPNYAPIPVLSSTNAICSPAAVSYSASGMISYTWQPVGAFAGSNSGTISATPTTNTTYTLFGTNAAGCPGYTTVSVNASTAPPVLNLAGTTQTVCLGGPATITASGALTYTLSNAAANGGTFAPTSTATYTINSANACGSGSAVATITVTPLPITATAPVTLVCASTAATLTAGGATSYTWMPGTGTQSTYVVFPSASTIYTITGKTGVCMGTNTLAITTQTNPGVSIMPTATTVCEGDAVSLTATGNALTYTWSVNSQTMATIAVSPTTSTLYSLIGTNAAGCTSNASQVVVVNAKPVIGAAASDDLICVGGTATLTANGGNTYLWSDNTGAVTTAVSPALTTVYTVTGTANSTNCSNTATVLVTVFDPTLSITSATSVCKGTSVIMSAAGMDGFVWSTGSSFSSITVTPTLSTTYSVTGSSVQGAITCTNVGTVMVTVNPNPTVVTVATPTGICAGESSVLNATGAASYSWTASTVVNASHTVTPAATQSYTVSGMDANGCKGTSIISVRVSACVGISSNTANTVNMLIYPNPSSDVFTISADQAIDLQVINELGQLVKIISLSKEHTTETVHNLASGIYFITGANENGSVKQKIVITK